MVFPALPCPEETEKLGLEGEKGEGRHSRLGRGEAHSLCKDLRGRRQQREEVSVSGAVEGQVCAGNKAPERVMEKGRASTLLHSQRKTKIFETVRNVMELSGVHETATYPGKRKSRFCLFHDSVKTHNLFIKMGKKNTGTLKAFWFKSAEDVTLSLPGFHPLAWIRLCMSTLALIRRHLSLLRFLDLSAIFGCGGLGHCGPLKTMSEAKLLSLKIFGWSHLSHNPCPLSPSPASFLPPCSPSPAELLGEVRVGMDTVQAWERPLRGSAPRTATPPPICRKGFCRLKPERAEGFAARSMVKNPPANAEDTGSIPDLG